jgi:hypothetical protein
MAQQRTGRKIALLWGLIAIALVYLLAMHYLHTLTGGRVLDSAIGVALGLYICSHPAANAVDALFFDRGALRRLTSGWSGLGWLALNLLVLLIGWVVLSLSVTGLAGKSI